MKLTYHKPLSNLAFNINLRPYTEGAGHCAPLEPDGEVAAAVAKFIAGLNINGGVRALNTGAGYSV